MRLARVFIVVGIFLTGHIVFGQNEETLRLKKQLLTVRADSSRVMLLVDICNSFRNSNYDSALYYGKRALQIAEQIQFTKGQIRALTFIGRMETDLVNLPEALSYELKAIQIAEQNNLKTLTGLTYNNIGSIYLALKDYPTALAYYKKSESIYKTSATKEGRSRVMGNTANVFTSMNQLDSALIYVERSIAYSGNSIDPLDYNILGKIHAKLFQDSAALAYFHTGARIAELSNNKRVLSYISNGIAEFYKDRKQNDSSIYYAKKGFEEAKSVSANRGVLNAAELLAGFYEESDLKQALYYYKIAMEIKEGQLGSGNIQTLQAMIAREEERQREIETAKTEFNNKLKLNIFLGSSVTLLIIAFFLFRTSRLKQKAKENIEKAYDQLKSTQSQLIQSEKMASLGELTAGIAHEIQNPLNFVNNFSEVNTELIDELKKELAIGNRQLAEELADDIKENESKILHHGKRADAIVKGMLQHSRSGSGTKEPTDINALADEYLRLAYHGLRAKDKSFNAKFETEFESSLPKINVVTQDIGRVILNLITNAFYTVNEKAKLQPSGYEPQVVVSTKNIADKIEVRVKDNGNGIPDSIKEKIFQPFFTTKPTGQGTGLGLSMSYDIVTKGHNGEIKVETQEGIGTEFIINLPIK